MHQNTQIVAVDAEVAANLIFVLLLQKNCAQDAAVAFRHLGLYGLVEMLLFVFVLLVGYVYLLKKRALEWD